MHFADRNDYVMWATIMLLQAGDLKTDSNALENAVKHAQRAADYFYGAQAKNAQRNPFSDPPEMRKPPQVQVSGPAVPGERANVPRDTPTTQG